MNELEEKVTFLQNEKTSLKKTNQKLAFEFDDLKGQIQFKDLQLEEVMGHLEKAQVDSAKKVFDLIVKIKFIQKQWAKSTIEIKESILAQARVICLRVDLSEIILDKHIVDGRIEVILEDNDDNDDGANSEFNPVNPEADP